MSKKSRRPTAQTSSTSASASAAPTTDKSLLALIGTPQLAPPWPLSEVGLTLLALALGVLALGAGVATTLSGSRGLTVGALLVGWIVGLVVVGAYVWAVRTRTQADYAALRLVKPRSHPLLLALLGATSALTLDVLAGLASGVFLGALELRGASGLADWLAGGLLLLVVQPIVHGLVFAGVILPRLRASLGPWAGYLGMAALLAIYHVLAYGSGLGGAAAFWYGLIVPFGWGLVLGAVRLRTASTAAAIMAHAGYGLMMALLAFAVSA
ncbi:MAG: CPBP family intramembrane metalloprotease [Anaerolineae bacterium]|nr:CPBP family intramembrane metalloprotease [Anaerolineae bacterium]MDW8171737.1 CPBP family intramembrane glutamic endopeptidase [Anaerolineae bacterium]